jgi:hypothetical protein
MRANPKTELQLKASAEIRRPKGESVAQLVSSSSCLHICASALSTVCFGSRVRRAGFGLRTSL